MTNLEELRLKNKFCDRLMDSELSIGKARVLVDDLIQDYNMRDQIKMGEKLQLEAPRVMAFLEIIFDYVVSTHEEIKAIEEELDAQSRELRELCIASGEIKRSPWEEAHR